MAGSSFVNNLASNLKPAKTGAGVFVPDQTTTVDATVGGVAMIGTPLHSATGYIFWTCSGADARFTLDNSAPTSTNGHLVSDGDSSIWSKEMVEAAKWIRTGGTSATLHISELQA